MTGSTNQLPPSTSMKGSHTTVRDLVPYIYCPLIIGLIGVTYYLLQHFFFSCTDPEHWTYSLVFALAPAAIIYCFGVLHINRSIRNYGVFDTDHHGKRLTMARVLSWRWKTLFCHVLVNYLYALVLPLIWVIILLVDTKVPVCFYHGPDDKSDKADTIRHSRIVGFALASIPIVLFTFFQTIRKCCTSDSSEIINMEAFSKHEANHAKKYFESLMLERAEENGEHKVRMLMESVEIFRPKEFESKTYQKMTYGDMITVRDRLIDAYPILGDTKDRQVSREAAKVFKNETEIFKNLVRDGSMKMPLIDDQKHKHIRKYRSVNFQDENERTNLIVDDKL